MAFHLPPGARTMLVRAGAAAGIAAAFRSPAGGVLLTLEVFGARLDQELVPISLAAMIGYLTRTTILGDAHPFHIAVSEGAVPLASLFVVAPLMGLVAAPTGNFFIRMLARFRRVLPERWPLALRVTIGGVLVGGIGIFYPQVMSAGYPVIGSSLNGQIAVGTFVILFALKMIATSITFGSGAVGGLFAPTLVMGALFGGAFGYGFHAIRPELAPEPAIFVLLGMIVMFGSIVKGFWSGLLLVADMSGCYEQLLLPGIVAGGISYLISWEISDRSVFGLGIRPFDPVPRPLAETRETPAGAD